MADVVSLRKDEPKGLVIKESSGGVLRLTLNNPPANALSVATLEMLIDVLEEVSTDATMRVVVIAATAPVFSAGHDLGELTLHRADADEGRAFFERSFTLSARLMTLIAALPQAVIAEIDGLATAAGCELVAACDLAICTDTATFCMPGVNIGLVPASSMAALARTAHRKQVMEMVLTGETIDASTAKDFGLINRIVPRQYLRQVVDKYAAMIASKSPEAQRAVKSAFHRQERLSLEETYRVAATAAAESMMTSDAREGLGACLTGRTPVWSGK